MADDITVFGQRDLSLLSGAYCTPIVSDLAEKPEQVGRSWQNPKIYRRPLPRIENHELILSSDAINRGQRTFTLEPTTYLV
jgi:hypothetical protein